MGTQIFARFFIATVFYALCLVSCKNERVEQEWVPENALVFKDSLRLQEVGTIGFGLDTLTGFSQHSLQFNKIGGTSYLSFFNEYARCLYIYDYKTRTTVAKVRYELEGPDGVGVFYNIGHCLKSLDSIFLYVPQKLQLLLTDGKGSILRRYKIGDLQEDSLRLAYPDLRTVMPMTIKENKAYLSGTLLGIEPVEDHTKVCNVVEIDLTTGKTRKLLPRPVCYNFGQWGMVMKYKVYPCFNEHSGKFVYSFGLTHELIETDHEGYAESKYCGSKYFRELVPFSKKAPKVPPKDLLQRYDFITPAYCFLIYDPYRHLYYRFVSLPITVDEYNAPGRNASSNKVSVIILNEQFQKIGETLMPHYGYAYRMVFVNENGLHIANEFEYTKNESNLTFSIFLPVQNK